MNFKKLAKKAFINFLLLFSIFFLFLSARFLYVESKSESRLTASCQFLSIAKNAEKIPYDEFLQYIVDDVIWEKIINEHEIKNQCKRSPSLVGGLLTDDIGTIMNFSVDRNLDIRFQRLWKERNQLEFNVVMFTKDSQGFTRIKKILK